MKNQLAVIVGITLVLGLARVGAQAEDAPAGAAPAPKVVRPDRPARPEKPSASIERPNLTEIRDIVKSFNEQKKEYIQQQRELRKDAVTEAQDQRSKLRDKIKETKPEVAVVRQQAKESIEAVKAQAAEQARKLAEEAKANAAESRRRD
jgi:hypothetical protein